MSDDIAISVENVSKAYRIWNDPGARLKSPLLRACGGLFSGTSTIRQRIESKAAGYYRDFYALKDISFQVRKGESVGIIGRNGSGKSTLLQIIAGTLQPTAGLFRVTGRVAALLELSSGFNPEFTGRENVYLNAAVLGLTKTETDAKFDSIAAFADIGDFLDQPVKTYSSGMLMRLAFAVQAAVDPEVLIVDEALAVGDAPFQAKCFSRMRTLVERGVSVVLVSHDLAAIKSFCQRSLFLRAGRMEMHAQTPDVCRQYEVECMRDLGVPADRSARATHAAPRQRAASRLNPKFDEMAGRKRDGTLEVRFIDLSVQTQAGEQRARCAYYEELILEAMVESRIDYEGEIHVGAAIKDVHGTNLYSTTDVHGRPTLVIKSGQAAILRMPIRFPLRAGEYYISVSLFGFRPPGKYAGGVVRFEHSILFDYIEFGYFIEVEPYLHHCLYGPVHIDTTLEVLTEP